MIPTQNTYVRTIHIYIISHKSHLKSSHVFFRLFISFFVRCRGQGGEGRSGATSAAAAHNVAGEGHGAEHRSGQAALGRLEFKVGSFQFDSYLIIFIDIFRDI